MHTTIHGDRHEVALPAAQIVLPGGGRLTVRPIGRRDRRRLRRLFMAPERCNLGVLVDRRGGPGSGGFFRLDPPHSVFYVAVLGRGWDERIVGVCGWRMGAAAGEAEVVIGLLGDPPNAREIGSAMLDEVRAAAFGLGLRRLRAYVLPEELLLQNVFEHGGIPVFKDFAKGCYEYSIRPMPAAA